MTASLHSLFEEYSYRPRKSAGQNFLTDSRILDEIEKAIQCPPGDILLEVGGGYGALTERLIKKERPLTVVEVDHKLFAMLEKKFGGLPMLQLVKGDILKTELAPLAPPPPAKLTVAGNIPYYLTTPLITRLLTLYQPIVRRTYLMVQKEVADRLEANPGTKDYGALTLCARYFSTVRRVVEVPARCFKPRPKVDSAFIELTLINPLPLAPGPEKAFFKMVKAIFQSRRKVITNSLKNLGKEPLVVDRALKTVGLNPQVRGETLSMEKMMELSAALEEVASL
jgi:16S rRNA (adenine1518-N6/adenine1519-N6)-dimethyltransferase